jgi:predicted NAD/FAD-binding protein
LHLSTAIKSVQTLESGKVLLTTESGHAEEFDHVIMATHTDVTLNILKAGGGVSADEERILGGFEWNKNEAVVHSDTSVCTFSTLHFLHHLTSLQLMPKIPQVWSCWNYITKSGVSEDGAFKANHDAASL